MLSPEETTEFTKKLVDDGKLIEAGWEGLKKVAYSEVDDEQTLEHLRNAFFAGAQHLFACIMTVLDPDAEPTERDMQRMSNIHAELSAYLEEFKNKYLTQH